LTTKDDIHAHEMVKNMSNKEFLRIDEDVTTCIAQVISRLAFVAYTDVGEGREQDAEALRIAAIDYYYSSSRLASHKMTRTLQAVQPRIPG
jgi:hypothetical protein